MAGILQERQLLLSESVNDKLKEILENQKALAKQNDELRKENQGLMKELTTRDESTEGRRKRKRSSDVVVPQVLSKRFKEVYSVLVERGVVKPYDFAESVNTGENKATLEKIKKELKQEHGLENCPWTDLQIETQNKVYYKTRKDRNLRTAKGSNGTHAQTCKMQRRINAKLERRMAAFTRLKPTLETDNVEKIHAILEKDFMSSEESEYEEVTNDGQKVKERKGFCVRELSWERTKLKNLKVLLDNCHLKNLSPQARSMTLPRFIGRPSNRTAPDGPSWAVRQAMN